MSGGGLKEGEEEAGGPAVGLEPQVAPEVETGSEDEEEEEEEEEEPRSASPSRCLVSGTPAGLRCFADALEAAPTQPHQAWEETRLCRHQLCVNCLALQLHRNLAPQHFYQTSTEEQALVLNRAIALAAFPDWQQRLATSPEWLSFKPHHRAEMNSAVASMGVWYAAHFNLIGEAAVCLMPHLHWTWALPNAHTSADTSADSSTETSVQPGPSEPRVDYSRSLALVLSATPLSDEIRWTLALAYDETEEQARLAPAISTTVRQYWEEHASVLEECKTKISSLRVASSAIPSSSSSSSLSQSDG